MTMEEEEKEEKEMMITGETEKVNWFPTLEVGGNTRDRHIYNLIP